MKQGIPQSSRINKQTCTFIASSLKNQYSLTKVTQVSRQTTHFTLFYLYNTHGVITIINQSINKFRYKNLIWCNWDNWLLIFHKRTYFGGFRNFKHLLSQSRGFEPPFPLSFFVDRSESYDFALIIEWHSTRFYLWIY
jgi:hypothetical protein